MKNIFSLSVLLMSFTAFSQVEIKAENQELLEELSQAKSQLESRFQIKTVYKIQVFSGSISEAKKLKKRYDGLGLNYDSMIFYESPNYKVWVGNFRTKLDADRAFLDLKNDFPHAFVFQPGR